MRLGLEVAVLCTLLSAGYAAILIRYVIAFSLKDTKGSPEAYLSSSSCVSVMRKLHNIRVQFSVTI